MNSLGYIVSGNCTKTNPTTWLHRILLQPKENEVVDHIDGNPLNNCRSNLRICTQNENLFNKSFMSKNTSNYIGVSLDKKGINGHLRLDLMINEYIYVDGIR